jgi:hypothetical protein
MATLRLPGFFDEGIHRGVMVRFESASYALRRETVTRCPEFP